jgi:hypothetical protein
MSIKVINDDVERHASSGIYGNRPAAVPQADLNDAEERHASSVIYGNKSAAVPQVELMTRNPCIPGILHASGSGDSSTHGMPSAGCNGVDPRLPKNNKLIPDAASDSNDGRSGSQSAMREVNRQTPATDTWTRVANKI